MSFRGDTRPQVLGTTVNVTEYDTVDNNLPGSRSRQRRPLRIHARTRTASTSSTWPYERGWLYSQSTGALICREPLVCLWVTRCATANVQGMPKRTMRARPNRSGVGLATPRPRHGAEAPTRRSEGCHGHALVTRQAKHLYAC
jgi:hypothetical protein